MSTTPTIFAGSRMPGSSGWTVIGVTAEYRSMTHFREQVAVSARLEQYNSVRFTISYEVRNAETGELRCTGTTSHCFLDRDYKPIILRKVAPDYDTVFKGALRAENE